MIIVQSGAVLQPWAVLPQPRGFFLIASQDRPCRPRRVNAPSSNAKHRRGVFAPAPIEEESMKIAARCPLLFLFIASCGGSIAVSAPPTDDGGLVILDGSGGLRAALEPGPFCDSGAAEHVLRLHCASCHDQGAQSQEGFSFVVDVPKLTTSCTKAGHRYVVPGDPEGSELYQRVASGAMPPKQLEAFGYARPTIADLSILHAWINDCLDAVPNSRVVCPRAQ
jgi:hypothetical protein